MHDFIGETLLLNVCHCYLKCTRLVTFSLTLILKVRILDITKLLRNAERLENKNSHVNCLITYMFTGLLLTTEDMKKKIKYNCFNKTKC